MKFGKEVKLSLDNNFKTIYGTVDSQNLKTIYVKILTWAEPVEDFDVYTHEVSVLKKRIKNKLNENLTSNFEPNKYIVDFDIKNSGIRYGKKSYLNINITLFTNCDGKITTPVYKENMKSIIKPLLETLKNNESFKFKIKK